MTITRSVMYLMSCIAVFTWPQLTNAQVAAKSNSNSTCGYNVTSSVFDTDSNNLPFQVQSDGLGPYVTYGNTKSSTDSVISVIQANSCDWLLDLSSSAQRTVKLTLAYPASSGGTPPFSAATNIAARIISICSQNSANNGITYGKMTYAGQTLECGMGVAFNYGGISYTLRMDPASIAGTTWVQATCVGAVSGKCNSWTILPVPNTATNPSTGQSSAIGELFFLGRNGSLSPIGSYYVDFSFAITNP
jgi:hypothetical protein